MLWVITTRAPPRASTARMSARMTRRLPVLARCAGGRLGHSCSRGAGARSRRRWRPTPGGSEIAARRYGWIGNRLECPDWRTVARHGVDDFIRQAAGVRYASVVKFPLARRDWRAYGACCSLHSATTARLTCRYALRVMVNIPRRSEWWRSATLTARPCVSLLKIGKLATTCLVGHRRSSACISHTVKHGRNTARRSASERGTVAPGSFDGSLSRGWYRHRRCFPPHLPRSVTRHPRRVATTLRTGQHGKDCETRESIRRDIQDSPPVEIGPEGLTTAEGAGQGPGRPRRSCWAGERASLSHKWWVTSRGHLTRRRTSYSTGQPVDRSQLD